MNNSADQEPSPARSRNMARIRSQDTAPELALRSLMHRAGYRFRVHKRGLPGTPDLYLAKYNTAVFVHGCFWHGHQGCRRATIPKTRTSFWKKKIERNKQRDAAVMAQLKNIGIRTIVVWQCELKDQSLLLEKLEKFLVV